MASESSQVNANWAPDSPSETELLTRARTGDRVAFERLMRANNQRLFRVARSIVSNDAEAEDAVQDAYLAAFVGLAQFSARSSIRTWLTRIVINRALARRRTLLREHGRSDPGEAAECVPDARTGPEEAAALQQLRRRTEAAVDALPPTYRLVLVMRYFEGLTSEETADSLGVSEEAVRVRLHRARALLRESLEGRDPDALGVELFAFAGAGCNRIVAGVLGRLGAIH